MASEVQAVLLGKVPLNLWSLYSLQVVSVRLHCSVAPDREVTSHYLCCILLDRSKSRGSAHTAGKGNYIRA